MTIPKSPIVNQKDSPATDTPRDSRDSLIQFITHSRSRPIRMAGWLKNNNSTRTALWICDFVMPALFFTSLAILLTTDHDGYIPGTKELLSNSASASSAGAIVIYSILGLSALVSLVLLSISVMYFLNKSKVDTSYTKYESDLYWGIKNFLKSALCLNNRTIYLAKSADSKISTELKTQFVDLSASLSQIVTDIAQFCYSIGAHTKFSFKSNEDREDVAKKFFQLRNSIFVWSCKMITPLPPVGKDYESRKKYLNSNIEALKSLENDLNNVLNLVNRFDISGNIPLVVMPLNSNNIMLRDFNPVSLSGECLSKDDFIKGINLKMEEFNKKIESFTSLFCETLPQESHDVSPESNSQDETVDSKSRYYISYTYGEPDLYGKTCYCFENTLNLNEAIISLTKSANSTISPNLKTQLADLSLYTSQIVTDIIQFCHSIGEHAIFFFKSNEEKSNFANKLQALGEIIFYLSTLNIELAKEHYKPTKRYLNNNIEGLKRLENDLNDVLNLVNKFDISENIPLVVLSSDLSSTPLSGICLSKGDFIKGINSKIEKLNKRIESFTSLCKTLIQESHGEEITAGPSSAVITEGTSTCETLPQESHEEKITAEPPSVVITEGTSTSPDTQTPSRTS